MTRTSRRNSLAMQRLSVFVALLCIGLMGRPATAKIPRRLASQIHQRVIPAYYQGDTSASLKILTQLIEKLDDEALSEVDALLAHENVPRVAELLLDARLKLVLVKGSKAIDAAPAREATLSLPELHRRIEETIVAVEDLPFYQEEPLDLPDIESFQDAFWKIHVAHNRLRNATRMTEYGNAFINATLDDNLKSLTESQQELLNIDFVSLAEEIKQVASELQEIKTELRIRGVQKAAELIRSTDDFKQRLRAAYVIGFDGREVLRFLREYDRDQFSRPLLRDENLLESVEAYIKLAQESSGDLAMKSKLLFSGLHWWMRGRYGQGPDGFGLLKHAEAATSPAAQFALYMPSQPPKPTEPSTTGYQIPSFDRRHHFIWMYEYRSFVEQKLGTIDRKTTRTKLSTFY